MSRITVPTDYNSLIHGRLPKSRIERLAWKHKTDSDYNVRSSAAVILLNAGCLRFSAVASITQKSLRRHTIAGAAWILRRSIRNTGRRVFLPVDVHQTSAITEQLSEGRFRKPRRANPHADQ